MKVRVLMVCLGNICRSPTAEGVLRAALAEQQLDHCVEVDSAGTAAWHVGKAPDARSQAHARERGLELSHLRARQVSEADFEHFDYLLAMDQQNLADLQALQPAGSKAKLALLLSFANAAPRLEVPDPYYGGAEGFDTVLDLVTAAAQGFIQHLKQHELRLHTL